MSQSFQNRRQQRIRVEIPVTVTSVLDSTEGLIVNLSEGGALITGVSAKRGALIQIGYGEETVYARVMWSEVDRIGVRFPFELRDGALFEALESAQRQMNTPVAALTQATMIPTASPPRGMFGRFGRRA